MATSAQVSAAAPKKTQDPASLTHELLAAVDEGDLTVVKRLLRTPGIPINGTNKHGESPLHIAAGYGRLNIVKLLHKNGGSLSQMDKQGDSPLYWAARHGHLEVVEYLCKQGLIDINAQDKAGESALHVAAKYGHPEVLAQLCRAGASLDVQDYDGDTPLLCGCWHGYLNIVECLIQAGCSLEDKNNDRETALHVAAVRGYFAIVRLLCESGANLNATDRNGCSALQLATRRNHLDIVQYLCKQGCSVDIQDNNADTALHDACREGQLSLFHTLYGAKCNLNLPNMNGATPLHLAAKYGHEELVRCLCTAGCDVTAVTAHGFTADEVAANSGHDNLATLIHQLRQDDLRDLYVSDLVLGQVPMNRVKLLICGASGIGKTELANSLKCNFLRSLFRRRSPFDLPHVILKRTHGLTVEQVTIPGAGDFSVWDFSGLKEYYIAHEHFLELSNSIILLVFSLQDPVHKQIAQARFWLAMMKSKQAPSETIRFAGAGREGHKPFVVLVGSFADQQRSPNLQLPSSDVFAVPLASNMDQTVDSRRAVLRAMVDEFGDHFAFPDTVFLLDCRLTQTRDMKALRAFLGTLRTQQLKTQPWMPPLVSTLCKVLPAWCREHADFPVLTWANFHAKTRNSLNPLISEDRMKIVTAALHDMGEVVHISKGPLSHIVILDPSWLGTRIFGPALSPENSVVPQLKSVTGRVKFTEIQRVYPELDSISITHLFEHFELCTPSDADGMTYEFPCLMKMQKLFGLWERDPSFKVYAGVHLQCRGMADIFSPGLFPQIQVHAKRMFRDDVENQEVTLWSDGLKCCWGRVEALLQLLEPHKTIELVVRGHEDVRSECYSLLHQLYSLACQCIRSTNPGTRVTRRVLSVRDLREHRRPGAYSAMEVFEAARSDGVVRCSESNGASNLEETIEDLVCCGCRSLLAAAKSAPYASLKSVPLQTRVELCRLLDPPDTLGQDWCLLALQLEVTEEVPSIDQADDHGSPTDKLLLLWEKASNGGTVADLVDALRGIGREDAATVLIEGMSPFVSTSSPLVVKIPGVAVTSYVC